MPPRPGGVEMAAMVSVTGSGAAMGCTQCSVWSSEAFSEILCPGAAILYNKPMPELPEVETIARGVNQRMRGDRIVQAWFGSHPQPFKTPPARQAKGLAGRTILAVHRTGKHIVFELGATSSATNAPQRETAPHAQEPSAPDAQWIVHLGMTGRLLVTTPECPVAPHTHARLILASGRELRFVDPRRFGRLEFRDLRRDAAFGAPGAEPLTIGRARIRRALSRPAPVASRPLCSTRPCLRAWAISMPTKASFKPASGRGGGPTASRAPNSSGCGWRCARS